MQPVHGVYANVTANMNLEGSQQFAEPIAIRSTRTDLQQFEQRRPCQSPFLVRVCLSSENERAIDDYRHLLQTVLYLP